MAKIVFENVRTTSKRYIGCKAFYDAHRVDSDPAKVAAAIATALNLTDAQSRHWYRWIVEFVTFGGKSLGDPTAFKPRTQLEEIEAKRVIQELDGRPKNTSFMLGEHFSEFIESQVESGRYGSASDVVRAGLRLLEENEAKREALVAALVAGEESGPAVAFDFKAFLASKRRNRSAA